MYVLMTALHPEGGIRTFFRYIYGHPAFSGVSIDLVAPDNGLSSYLAEFVPEQRMNVIRARPGKAALIRQIRSLAGQKPYDLLHSHGFSAGILSEIARTGMVLPHLMTGHDVFMPSQFTGISGSLRHWFLACVFGRMTAIHTVGEDARKNLLEFFPNIPATRVHGILNGVDTAFFRDGIAKPVRAKVNVPDHVPLIGFLGRFMGQKGFRQLVDAMGHIVNERLLPVTPHVVTFGWNGFIREDYDYLRSKGLGDYFHQHEQSHEMPGILKGLDLVVMPSRWEACPLLAMEALAAGVPILGSDCIGLREVLTGSPARMFKTGDIQDLKQAIIQELTGLPRRKQDFLEYQPIAVTRFNYDKTARSLAALYSSLVKTV